MTTTKVWEHPNYSTMLKNISALVDMTNGEIRRITKFKPKNGHQANTLKLLSLRLQVAKEALEIAKDHVIQNENLFLDP